MGAAFEVVEIPQESALEIFTTPKGLEPYLKRIAAEVADFVPDLTTDAGRKEVASMAHRVARSKSAIDGVGKQVVDKLKEQPKLVDAERKRARDYLDDLKEKVRQPLTDWEQAEVAKVNAHEQTMGEIARWAQNDNGSPIDSTAPIDHLSARLECAKAYEIGPELEEYQERAELIKTGTIHTLETALQAAQAREAEREELAALRLEMQQREAREAEEREKREAQEAEAREKREAEAEEQRRIQAEKDAEAQAERDSLARRANAAEAALAEQEQIKRDADEAAEALKREAAEAEVRKKEEEADRKAMDSYKRKINSEAAESLQAAVESLEDGQVGMVIAMIGEGHVKHVSINY